MKTQLICAVVIQHHPISHDTKHFPKLFSQMLDIISMNVMVSDKGYDAEPVHKMIRNENVLSMIPVRNKDCLIGRTKGGYRKLMRQEFDCSLYHERNKTETIFSVVKRRFDSEIKSYDNTIKTKELAVPCAGLLSQDVCHFLGLDCGFQEASKSEYFTYYLDKSETRLFFI